MRLVTLRILAVACCLAGCGSPTAPSDTGLTGTVVRGPIRPVCEVDVSCGDAPFAETTIPILSATHLVACKVVFNRAKDWLDLEQMLIAVPNLDVGEIPRWLDHLADAGDVRTKRFNELRRRVGDG